MNRNIYKFNDKRDLIRTQLKINKFSQEGGGRIIYTYSRYMHKLHGLSFNNDNPPICPFYSKYIYSLTACLNRAKLIYENNFVKGTSYTNFEWPTSGNYYLDKITKSFIQKFLNIEIIYIYKYDFKSFNKERLFKLIPISIIDKLKILIFNYRSSNKNIRTIKSNLKIKSILYLLHKKSKKLEAFNFLEECLDKSFNKKEINCIKHDLSSIGISNKQRISAIVKSINHIFKNTNRIRFTLDNLIFINHYYTSIFLELNIIQFLKINKTRIIVTSIHDFERLDKYYSAAKKLKIRYLHFDYSIASPICKTSFLKYDQSCRKFGNTLYANSLIRLEQYTIAYKGLKSKPEIKIKTCPQVIYSLQKASLIDYISFWDDKNIRKLKLGIVDTTVAIDIYPDKKDLYVLCNFLKKNIGSLYLILQSKKGETYKLLDYKKNSDSIVTGNLQGDYSRLKEVDYIVSLGWQGTAIKAASVFDKPILFFSDKKGLSRNLIYSTNNKKDKLIKDYLEKLWIFSEDFFQLLNQMQDKEYFEKTKYYSNKLLKLIQVPQTFEIENYFEDIYKNL